MGIGESWEGHAVVVDAHDPRIRVEREVEGLGRRHLGDETDVRDRGALAMAEPAARGMLSVEFPLSALTSTSAASSAFGLNRPQRSCGSTASNFGHPQASAAASIGETVTAALSGFVLHLTSATRNP